MDGPKKRSVPLPIFAFVPETSEPLNDWDLNEGILQEQWLAQLVARVQVEQVTATYRSPDDLVAKVLQALTKYLLKRVPGSTLIPGPILMICRKICLWTMCLGKRQWTELKAAIRAEDARRPLEL